MATPHNRAEKGDFAKVVLMPGDPLRAKFISDHYLADARLVTDVRGMLGYTGFYQGVRVSVMGSGMGQPSLSIYAYELFTAYDVDVIVRVGSAGAYDARLPIRSVVNVAEAYSESSLARVAYGFPEDIMAATPAVHEGLAKAARALHKTVTSCRIHSADAFYRPVDNARVVVGEGKDCLAVEMESFALFAAARATGKSAGCLLTISDSFVSNEVTTPAEREKTFTDMMEIALTYAHDHA